MILQNIKILGDIRDIAVILSTVTSRCRLFFSFIRIFFLIVFSSSFQPVLTSQVAFRSQLVSCSQLSERTRIVFRG
jgi:hypothetical protein